MGRPALRRTSRVVFCMTLLAPALTLSGCGGPTRSAAAVCKVWNTDAVSLHNKYAADATNSSDGFSSLLDAVTAPNDLATLMDKMDAVAPESIEPDFKALADAFHDESKSEGSMFSDPLGSLIGDVTNGLAVSGSEQRVDTYLQNNCAGSPGIG